MFALLVKRREAKMCDFNLPTEHTLLLYIIGKTINRNLIISRWTIDNWSEFLINRLQRSLLWCCL